jgi:hypothetical protein
MGVGLKNQVHMVESFSLNIIIAIMMTNDDIYVAVALCQELL